MANTAQSPMIDCRSIVLDSVISIQHDVVVNTDICGEFLWFWQMVP